MDLFNYFYDRYYQQMPLVLIKPFGEIMKETIRDVIMIFIAFFLLRYILSICLNSLRKPVQNRLRNAESETDITEMKTIACQTISTGDGEFVQGSLIHRKIEVEKSATLDE